MKKANEMKSINNFEEKILRAIITVETRSRGYTSSIDDIYDIIKTEGITKKTLRNHLSKLRKKGFLTQVEDDQNIERTPIKYVSSKSISVGEFDPQGEY